MALEPGQAAPALRLPDAHGGPDETIAFHALTLVAFLKHNCPVCQIAAPYIEKFRSYEGAGLHVVTVMEDPAGPAAAFAREYGLTMPLALDEAPYKASSAYRLTNVPTVFLVEPGGRVAETLVNWNKDGYNGLSAEAARRLGQPEIEVSPPNDGAPIFRPG